MVTKPAYAPTLIETARANIVAVASAFVAATGLSETFVARVMRNDGAFIRRLPETTMNIRTYDEIMGKMSAIWPAGAAWPCDVPRPAPVAVSAEERAEVDARIAKQARAEAEAQRKAAIAALKAKLAEVIAAPAEAVQAPART